MICLLFSALDYDWWTTNGYPNPFRFIVECTVLVDQSVHDIDFQLDLIDVNDNPPRFSQSIYQIDVLESTPINSIVSTAIFAHDPDSGIFGAFSYYLLDNSSAYSVRNSIRKMKRKAFFFQSYFRLVNSNNASLVLIHPLDYNLMVSNFNLTIIAQVLCHHVVSSL